MTAAADAPTDVRPFRVAVPDAELDDLRSRLARTRWPDPETVPDWSQGVRLENAQGAGRVLGARVRLAPLRVRAERLPAVPDHDRRARHPLPPRPVPEPRRDAPAPHPRLAELGRRLPGADRPAHRPGRARRRRSTTRSTSSSRRCPGSGSPGSRPRPAGTSPASPRAWAELMRRLGYDRWTAHGGDWGAAVTTALGRPATRGPARHPPEHAVRVPEPDPRRRSPPRSAARWTGWPSTPARSAGRTTCRARRPETVGVRAGRLAGRPGGLDLREVPVQDRQPGARRGRPRPRRHARHDLAVLVHQQRRVVRPHLLGEPHGDHGRSEARAARRGDRVPARHPAAAAELDRGRVQRPRPLRARPSGAATSPRSSSPGSSSTSSAPGCGASGTRPPSAQTLGPVRDGRGRRGPARPRPRRPGR